MPRTSSGTCSADHERTFHVTDTHTAKPVSPRLLSSLPYSQAHPGRHKCAACAYEAGYRAGFLKAEAEMRRKLLELAKVRHG